MKNLLSRILLFVMLIIPAVSAQAGDDYEIAEETVWVTRTGQRYHNEDCRTLRGGNSEIPISEARERGLTACGVCWDMPEHSVDIQPNSLHFVRVVRIIDGDTITVEMQNGTRPERVRFIGVDAPETRHPQRGVEFFGQEASDFTAQALANRHIWIQFDVGIRDRFGRLLAYIWTEKPEDKDNEEEVRDKMFNARLLFGGYAQVMTIQPNSRYAELFIEFQREAREESRGLWQEEENITESYGL